MGIGQGSEFLLLECEATTCTGASEDIFLMPMPEGIFSFYAGPAGTPYSGGCFMFDIYFQPDYPSIPPLVLITTTGRHLQECQSSYGLLTALCSI